MFVIQVEDSTEILASPVTKLTLTILRVNICPEDFQQRLIADRFWVVGDFNHLEMTGFPTCDLLVGGVLGFPPRITRDGADHTIQFVEGWLHAPEAATRKEGLFRIGVGCGEHSSQ